MMRKFHKFFWIITLLGLGVISADLTYHLIERSAQAQQIDDIRPTMIAPIHDEEPAAEAPVERIREHGIELPDEVVERILAKRAPKHSDVELYLSFAVLAFGFLVMLGQFLIMLREHRYFDNMSLKMLTITMAITSALFLITAGFSSDQIQPAIGLISGTLGFAFGLRGDTPQTETQSPPAPKV